MESDIARDDGIDDPESPEQQDVSAATNVPGFIRPIWKWKWQAENVSVAVNTLETRRIQGMKKK